MLRLDDDGLQGLLVAGGALVVEKCTGQGMIPGVDEGGNDPIVPNVCMSYQRHSPFDRRREG